MPLMDPWVPVSQSSKGGRRSWGTGNPSSSRFFSRDNPITNLHLQRASTTNATQHFQDTAAPRG